MENPDWMSPHDTNCQCTFCVEWFRLMAEKVDGRCTMCKKPLDEHTEVFTDGSPISGFCKLAPKDYAAKQAPYSELDMGE